VDAPLLVTWANRLEEMSRDSIKAGYKSSVNIKEY
jgi:hypothetical protein